ncbi:protein SLC31A2 isoform X2 [Struthio camelus]|uniref:protein SLC31A2 isoform X2 n=1 Tax=Struthio camelus TaxID=8801 RepID=UPI0023FF0D05
MTGAPRCVGMARNVTQNCRPSPAKPRMNKKPSSLQKWMVLSVLVILLLSVLYETVKIGKAKVLHRTMLAIPRSLSQESLAERDEGADDTSWGQHDTAQGRWFLYHVSQTLLHVIQVVVGYMVMLAVMSYNAWIFLGVIVGSALGYFVVFPLLNVG